MKNLVVAAFVLLLAYYGPQRDEASRFDVAWMLGALALVAASFGQLAQAARLPALVGWLAAGLVLGASGLQVVGPSSLALYPVLFLLAGLWVGFQIGLHVVWPPQWDWRGPVLMALATILVFAVTTAAVAVVAELPWDTAVLIGALASLWGPFTAVPEHRRRSALLLSLMGSGFALVLLSGALALLEGEALVEVGATAWAGCVWLSLVAGGALGLGLRLAGLFDGAASTLVTVLLGGFLCAAIALAEWGLMALPCGLAVGLVQGSARLASRRVRLLLHRAAPVPFILFFALVGTALDLRALWPPEGGLWQVALVLVAVPVLLRGLAPMAYYPLPGLGQRIGWLLLPRGALLFELFYGPHGLAQYAGLGGLLGQAVLVDVVFSALVFSALAPLLGTGEEDGDPKQTA